MKRLGPAGQPRLVAIVGGSGAGKSWLAQQLQRRLGKEATRLCLDDFYRDRAQLPVGQRGQINFDHPRAIDWPLFEAILRACRAGRLLAVPRYDFSRHVRRRSPGWWRPKPVVLVEGLWLLRRASLRRLFALSIFIECGEKARLRRRLERDQAERGRDAAAIRKQFREQVAPMHQRHVAPQARWATVVVRSPMDAREVERLVAQIRSCCPAPGRSACAGRSGALVGR